MRCLIFNFLILYIIPRFILVTVQVIVYNLNETSIFDIHTQEKVLGLWGIPWCQCVCCGVNAPPKVSEISTLWWSSLICDLFALLPFPLFFFSRHISILVHPSFSYQVEIDTVCCQHDTDGFPFSPNKPFILDWRII